MNPKEKAEELVNKFTFRCEECDYDWNAKQCALIAVDEILDVIDRDMNYQNVYSFYLEVKQEIEKL